METACISAFSAMVKVIKISVSNLYICYETQEYEGLGTRARARARARAIVLCAVTCYLNLIFSDALAKF